MSRGAGTAFPRLFLVSDGAGLSLKGMDAQKMTVGMRGAATGTATSWQGAWSGIRRSCSGEG